MRKFLVSSLVVAGALAVGVPSASAGDRLNGSFTGTSTDARFGDASNGQTYACSNSTISGVAGTSTFQINSGSFTGCTGALGSAGTGTLATGTFQPVSYDPVGDTVSGTIPGAIVTFAFHDFLGTCNTTASGAFGNVTYSNRTGILTFVPDTPAGLTITSATGSGCAGLIRAGDKVTFSATYAISPPFTIRPVAAH